MTVISAAFSDLESVLASAGLTVDDETVQVVGYRPQIVQPPFAQIGPSVSEDYLTFDDGGTTFGGATLHLAVQLVVPTADNDVQVEWLHGLILQVLDAIEESGEYDLTRVNRPGQAPLNGQTYLGAIVEVATQINLRSS